jgi:hypothetical protein
LALASRSQRRNVPGVTTVMSVLYRNDVRFSTARVYAKELDVERRQAQHGTIIMIVVIAGGLSEYLASAEVRRWPDV